MDKRREACSLIFFFFFSFIQLLWNHWSLRCLKISSRHVELSSVNARFIKWGKLTDAISTSISFYCFFFFWNVWFPKQIICLSNEYCSWVQNAGWTPVPQFGGWDQKGPNDATNYSVVFSQARANRKQNKAGVRHSSLGSEQELMASVRRNHQQLHHRHETQDDDPVMVINIYLSLSLSLLTLPWIPWFICTLWWSFSP